MSIDLTEEPLGVLVNGRVVCGDCYEGDLDNVELRDIIRHRNPDLYVCEECRREL